jgi:serine/threonine protein phosphatase 1
VTDDLAFVGDIHGNVVALDALWRALPRDPWPHVVFLGDYIDRGQDSAGVLQRLIDWSSLGRATVLAGNHELTLLRALETGDLRPFLKIGGAATIRSYVDGNVGPDALASFAAAFPRDHLRFLQSLSALFQADGVVAQHEPTKSSDPRFQISAHRPVGDLPLISVNSAEIDTGCNGASGRLTGLLWPSLDVIQVDSTGRRI